MVFYDYPPCWVDCLLGLFGWDQLNGWDLGIHETRFDDVVDHTTNLRPGMAAKGVESKFGDLLECRGDVSNALVSKICMERMMNTREVGSW